MQDLMGIMLTSTTEIQTAHVPAKMFKKKQQFTSVPDSNH